MDDAQHPHRPDANPASAGAAPPPDDVAVWIDERDLDGSPIEQPPVEVVLERQREEHEPGPGSGGGEIADDGIAAIVNNTGHDGGAASG